MSKPIRPSSNGKAIQVQTFEFEQQPTQPQAVKQIKKVQLGQKSQTQQQQPVQTNEFDQFMQQRLQDSGVKRIYEQKQQDEQLQKVTSKPFQIQKQQQSKPDESKSEFTSTSSKKKPYNKFYSNIRSVDTSKPSGKVADNPSFASTEKSYELSNEEVNDSQLSVKSEEISRMSASNQSFRNFVQQKKNEQQIDYSRWTLNQTNQIPVIAQTERFYQNALDKIEQIIQNRNDKRKEYIGDLEKYIEQLNRYQPKVNSKKQKQKKVLDEVHQLERSLKELNKELKNKEEQVQNQKAQVALDKLQLISEEPLENLSSKQIKNRSMFVTQLLKNRSQLTDQIEETQSDMDIGEVDGRIEKQKRKYEQSSQHLPPDMERRLDELLEGIEDYVSGSYDKDENPFDMFKEESAKQKWDMIHRGLREHKVGYEEFDSLWLDPGSLPKDKFLKEQAESRIIKQKMDEVNNSIMELANKKFEDKFKIKDMVESMMKKSGVSKKLKNNSYLDNQFKELERYDEEAKEILKHFDANLVLRELQELKSDLDQAILISNSINAQIEDQVGYQQNEMIKQKQVQIGLLEEECNEINKRADIIIRMEENLRMLVQDQFDEQLDEQEERKEDDEQGRSLDDYDREMTEKAKQANPSIFTYTSNSLFQQEYEEVKTND